MADPSPGEPPDEPRAGDSVGSLAELYLGNLLYALERCALSLELEDKPLDASFYRAIGRKLAEAHGRHRR